MRVISVILAFLWVFFGFASVLGAEAEEMQIDAFQSREVNASGTEKTFGSGSYWRDGDAPFFGSSLFKGHFAKQDFSGISPDYKIAIDDQLEVYFWGAFTLEKVIKVDKQGNIFLPEIGTVKVAGVKSGDLNEYLKGKIKKTFNKNVEIYATLLASNRLRVFVTGPVMNPGIYEGLPFSSVIYYLDKAGGIDPEKGSYIDVSVIRAGRTIKGFNLYSFLVDGKIDQFQFHDGDVIHVGAKRPFVIVTGDVINRNKFEVSGNITGKDIIKFASPVPAVNRVSVVSNMGGNIVANSMTLQDFTNYKVRMDDRIDFVTQLRPESISIYVRGEHTGESVEVVPYGASLDVATRGIKFTPFSAKNDLILYRKSAAKRQKEMFDKVLDNLEQKMLNYGPISIEEAKIHQEEVRFLKEFIQKARAYQPSGLLMIYEDGKMVSPDTVFLEDEDVIFVPKISNFISTFGYVTNPSFIPFDESKRVRDYIKLSGGITNGGSEDEIFIRKVNGQVERISLSYRPKPGEEIVVMPVIKFKTFQFAKDVISAIYQIAVVARVFVYF